MPKEEAWHRNVRATRSTARGILAAEKLGLQIPQEAIVAAKRVLIAHHGTGAQTKMTWATEQMKMQNRIMQEVLSTMMPMGKGNYHMMSNQLGLMPWGKGGYPDGKGGLKGGGKGGKGGGKAGGGKGMKANAPIPGLCGRCGGMHTKNQ